MTDRLLMGYGLDTFTSSDGLIGEPGSNILSDLSLIPSAYANPAYGGAWGMMNPGMGGAILDTASIYGAGRLIGPV